MFIFNINVLFFITFGQFGAKTKILLDIPRSCSILSYMIIACHFPLWQIWLLRKTKDHSNKESVNDSMKVYYHILYMIVASLYFCVLSIHGLILSDALECFVSGTTTLLSYIKYDCCKSLLFCSFYTWTYPFWCSWLLCFRNYNLSLK